MESKVENNSYLRITEWLAIVLNIGFTILYINQNPYAFIFGITGPLFIAFLSWKRKLFADLGLQIIYTLLAIWGMLYLGHEWKVNEFSIRIHLIGIIFSLVVGLLLGLALKQKTSAALPYFDSLITSFSIWATILMMLGCHENWIYFIFINLTCIFLFWNRQLKGIAFLYLIYLLMAIDAYFQWGFIGN